MLLKINSGLVASLFRLAKASRPPVLRQPPLWIVPVA